MNKYVCVLLLLFIVGCVANYSGYSNYSPYLGFSSYFKKTTGTSNLRYGYKDPPVLDANSPLAKFELKYSVTDYLDGVVNDLKQVEDNADNATEKINALVAAVNSGFEYFNVRHVGSVYTFSSKSNFGLLGYPECPDFDYIYIPPTKPQKPLFLDDEFTVEAYNTRVRAYNREVADFAATVKAYIEDAEHYIENCKNDYEEIRQKGLTLLSCVESLGIDAKVDLYRAGRASLSKFPERGEPKSYSSAQQTKSEPEPTAKVGSSPGIISGYKVKIDASGEIVKDKDGNFVLVPIYEDEQKKDK